MKQSLRHNYSGKVTDYMCVILSIIIPTYNCKNYMDECLTSVLNSLPRNAEVIVVDDGSHDGTQELFVIRFFESSAVFEMLDDGKCIALDQDPEIQELITDNYGLVKKLGKSVEYQYIPAITKKLEE